MPDFGAEASALKIELAGAITRRMRGEQHSPTDQLSITLAAMAESVADMIFAAARDQAHGERLLQIFNMQIEGRWRTLADRASPK